MDGLIRYKQFCILCINFLVLIDTISAGWKKFHAKGDVFQGVCHHGNPCSQMCINVKQGYKCACYRGYMLDVDGTSCIRSDPVAPSTVSPSHLQRLRFPALYHNGNNNTSDSRNYYNSYYRLQPHDNNQQQHSAWQNDGPSLNGRLMTTNTSNSMYPKSRVTMGGGKIETADRKLIGRKGKGRKNKNKNKQSSKVSDGYQNDAAATTNIHQDQPPTSGDNLVQTSSNLIQRPDVPKTFKDCSKITCGVKGRCVKDTITGTGVRCRCPLGQIGDHCENAATIQFPHFWGTGYLALPVLRSAYKELQIRIEFRPEKNDGLLLFSADREAASHDFFAVVLRDGRAEFRFDCGTGPAVIITKNTIKLNEWNTITAYRKDWDGSITLNNGTTEYGRSKGYFSRLTLRLDTFLGGFERMLLIARRVGTSNGFTGCVKKLLMNHIDFDMRKGTHVGDALYGVDVRPCSSGLCENWSCYNGGVCRATSPDRAVCMCPVGTVGDRCGKKVDIHVPSFNGNSYLQLLGMQRRTLMFTELELVIKPSQPSGLVLYNGYRTDGSGDFIALVLTDGYVEFRYELGTGTAVIRSIKPIEMNKWHTIRAARTGRDGWLQIDNEAAVLGSSPGGYTQLTLNLDLYIGGHRNNDELAQGVGLTKSFVGCIQKVMINDRPLKLMDEYLSGVNIDNCVHPCVEQPCLNGGQCVPMYDRYKCDCPLGFDSLNCEERKSRFRYRFKRGVISPVTIPMFSGDSYLLFDEPFISERMKGVRLSLYLHLRVLAPEGLILWLGDENSNTSGDFLALSMSAGHLMLRYDLGSGEGVITERGASSLMDGHWHSVKIKRYQRTATIQIDNGDFIDGESPGKLQQLNVANKLYLGGLPTDQIADMTRDMFTKGFEGCISEVILDDNFPIRLMEQASEGVNIKQCV